MSKNLTSRLDEEVFQCQMNERNVAEEIRIVINNNFTQGRQNIAKILLNFLDDKYDMKRWIVVVSPDTGDSSKVYSIQSAGFHTASSNGIFAAAISFYPSPELITEVNARMKDFKFPIESYYYLDVSYRLREKASARDVYDYLNRYMSPLRTSRSEAVIESIVVETPCTATEEAFKIFVTVTSSNDTGYVALNNKGNCINHLVVIVPVKPFNSSATALQDLQCYNDGVQNGLLRNEFGQAYLSVLNDSSQEAAYVILDRTWKNSTGQRWKFVNNQLVNEHGKCLTAWILTSTYLYQYNCQMDWMGQIWYRVGLNIVNGFNLCLAYKSTPNDPVMYLVQAQCDSTPPYLWYEWDADCEDAMVIPSIGSDSRPLKNEFSRRYLTVYNDGYALNEPLNNEAGQNWKFVDNQLTNDYGKCLAGRRQYVLQVDCEPKTDPSTMWNYNEKRQIVSNSSGYCLSTGNADGCILYTSCSDTPEYRWW